MCHSLQEAFSKVRNVCQNVQILPNYNYIYVRDVIIVMDFLVNFFVIDLLCLYFEELKRTVFTRSSHVMWRNLLLFRRSTKLSEISVTIHILFFIVNFIETKQMQTCKRMIYRNITDRFFLCHVAWKYIVLNMKNLSNG